jgi:chromosome partitioning protein
MTHIISIIGQKGGIGKTTVAWNLFIYLKYAKYKVKLIDCDNNQFSSFEIAKIRQITVNDNYINDVIATPASKAIDTINNAQDYDVILLECGGRIDNELKMAISYADQIIMPLKPALLEIKTIYNVEKVIKRIPDFSSKCRILPNMTSSHICNNAVDQMRDLKTEYFNFMNSELKHRSIYSNSISQGLSIYETRPVDHKATGEFDKFIKELQK